MNVKKTACFALLGLALSASAFADVRCIGDRLRPLCVGDVVRLNNVKAVGRVIDIDEISLLAVVDWGLHGIGNGRGVLPREALTRSTDYASNGVSPGAVIQFVQNGCRGRVLEAFEDGSAAVQWGSPCAGLGLIEARELRVIGGGNPPPTARPFRLLQRDVTGRTLNIPVAPVGPRDSVATIRAQRGDTLVIFDGAGRQLSIQVQ